jgi:hypothetical protein
MVDVSNENFVHCTIFTFAFGKSCVYRLDMTQSAHIIEKFGGARPLARFLGKPPTTVQSWKDAGFIPSKYHGAILRAAFEGGIDLTASDFIVMDEAI